MLPVLDEHGTPAGFIGRARPGSRPAVPKYLNSPETATYRKGDLLFGLHQARGALARGAVPVIAEGPFDAIAITIADPAQHVGLAPCGTALTSQQVAALAAAADLPRIGVLAAFDSDQAGRKAATRAYGILRPVTGKLGSVLLAAKDPAEILQRDGPAALRAILRDQIQPLSAVIIDARIEPWERRLRDTGGPLLALRDAASADRPPAAARHHHADPSGHRGPGTHHDGRPAPPSRQPGTHPRSPACCPLTPPTRSCESPTGSASTSRKS